MRLNRVFVSRRVHAGLNKGEAREALAVNVTCRFSEAADTLF